MPLKSSFLIDSFRLPLARVKSDENLYNKGTTVYFVDAVFGLIIIPVKKSRDFSTPSRFHRDFGRNDGVWARLLLSGYCHSFAVLSHYKLNKDSWL